MLKKPENAEHQAIREKRRERFLEGIDVEHRTGVEIGALCWPLVQRSKGAPVIYVDHTDTPHLREKYREDPNVDVNEIVDVDAVWGQNTLHEAIGGRFVDYVVASHVVEHVPDLVTWLMELASVLRPSGEIRLIVPDKRYTFDYFRRESQLPEVLTSYLAKARVPQPYALVDFFTNFAEVSAADAWADRVERQITNTNSVAGALHLAKDAVENGTYHDVYCWVFTPQSFAYLLGRLAEANLTDLACEGFRNTAFGDIEFSVILRRTNDRQYIVDSWRKMEQAVSQTKTPSSDARARSTLDNRLEPEARFQKAERMIGVASLYDPRECLTIPPGFDSDAHLRVNPDVAAAGIDAAVHYRAHGWREGRPVA